jgi:hypothetical protein
MGIFHSYRCENLNSNNWHVVRTDPDKMPYTYSILLDYKLTEDTTQESHQNVRNTKFFSTVDTERMA